MVMGAAGGERQRTSLTQSLNPFQSSHNVLLKIKDTNNAYFVQLMDMMLFTRVDVLLHEQGCERMLVVGLHACMHACRAACMMHACMHACTHVSCMHTCVQSVQPNAFPRECMLYEVSCIITKLSAMDVLAHASMKDAAKCDTHCELQILVNHQISERIWRCWDYLTARLFQCL